MGTGNNRWSSVSLDDSNGYHSHFSSTAVNSSGNYSYTGGLPLRCLVNSTVGRVKNRNLEHFGRAGRSIPTYYQFRDIGSAGIEWTSIASATSDSYGFGLNSVGVYPYFSYSHAYGFPLRCLVNSTVGEIGKGKL